MPRGERQMIIKYINLKRRVGTNLHRRFCRVHISINSELFLCIFSAREHSASAHFSRHKEYEDIV